MTHMIQSHMKSKEAARDEFMQFNGIILSLVLVIWIISKNVPSGIITLKSKVMLDLIFPLVYFTSFSFFFGALFLVGEDVLNNYLRYFFTNELLDLGLIAAYTGAIALILANFIKIILETIYGLKITSTFIIDVFGFVLGRFILLTTYGFISM